MTYRPPLHVHVVHHPLATETRQLGEHLVRWFVGEPAARTPPEEGVPPVLKARSDPDVPTFLWTHHSVERGQADHEALVLLVDVPLVASPEWRAWAEGQMQAGWSVVILAAISPKFRNIGPITAGTQVVRLYELEEEARLDGLVIAATHALARRLAAPRSPRLFISHAKADGVVLAMRLKAFLDARPLGQQHFFDSVSIEAGDTFEDTLTDALSACAVVALVTDAFAGRYWCAWEVFTARQNRRPIVIVDALSVGEPACVGSLGRRHTLRWDPARPDDAATMRRVMASAFLAVLRHEHDLLRLASVQRATGDWEGALLVGTVPELATLPPPAGAPIRVLHPDPPLPAYEARLLATHRPDVTVASFTQALSGGIGRARVALSISNAHDLPAHGVLPLHIQRLWEGLLVQLLAKGAEVAYGGDLSTEGFTTRMFDLVRGMLDAGQRVPDAVVHHYIGWPVTLQVTDDHRAGLPNAIQLHEAATPPRAFEGTPYVSVPNADPLQRVGWALGMREMRLRMARECDARVLVGGQVRSVSAMPGLVEELLVSVGKPVYLVGGFGGLTGMIVQALKGGAPIELTDAFQDEGRPGIRQKYAEAVAAGAPLEPADYPALVARLNRLGTGCLDNGLSDAENERLFVSRDPVEVVATILVGLGRRFAR